MAIAYVVIIFIILLAGTFFYWKARAKRVLQKDKKILQELVSLLVHDLRGPLDNIQKMAELMISSKKITIERKEQYTKFMHDSASGMLILINNISDAAKLGAGTLKVHKEKKDLSQLIEDRVSFFALAISNAQLSVETVFDEDIPKEILLDTRIVSDAFNILLANAIKFNYPDGWITVNMFIHHEGENIDEEAKKKKMKWFPVTYSEGKKNIRSVVIGVSHSDPGIPMETLPFLFQKYEHAGEAFLEKVKQAHGISLYLAKHLVRYSGGMIGAGSQENKGTTFYFTLPLD